MAGGSDFSFRALAGGFYRPEEVLSDVAKARARVEAKFGAYARRVMMNSIEYKDSPERKAILGKILAEQSLGDGRNRFRIAALREQLKKIDDSAPPGRPPYAHHSGAFTKLKRDRKTGAVTRRQSSPLRELIFFARDPAAGSVVVGPVAFGARGARALEKGGTVAVTRGGKRVSVRIAPHPFAEPAGRAASAKLPEVLRDMAR